MSELDQTQAVATNLLVVDIRAQVTTLEGAGIAQEVDIQEVATTQEVDTLIPIVALSVLVQIPEVVGPELEMELV